MHLPDGEKMIHTTHNTASVIIYHAHTASYCIEKASNSPEHGTVSVYPTGLEIFSAKVCILSRLLLAM